MHSTTHLLDCGWTFTQIGGGQGTEDGEWLETSAFPTSVHVELSFMAVRWASRGGCAVYAATPLTHFAGSIDVMTPDLTVRIFRDWGSGLGLQDVLRGW